MAEMKTTKNEKDPRTFLSEVENDKRREDAIAVMELMEDVLNEPPTMWGDSIIGFGKYHYKYESGRENDWFVAGFSPRKQNIALYLIGGSDDHEALVDKLGKHKKAKSCMYINKLEDVDLDVLRELVRDSAASAARIEAEQS